MSGGPAPDAGRPTVGVVGAGVMGSGIAQAFAQGGYAVICQDVDAAQLERAGERVRTGRYGLARAVGRGRLTPQQADAAAARLRWTSRLGDLAGCELVIESVPEDPEVKRRVLAELGAAVASEAIVATNSSGLPVTSLRDALPAPERFLAWHWASPAQISPFAEIVTHDGTELAVVDRVRELAQDLGRNPVVVTDDVDAWGYVANRLYAAMLAEATRVVDAGSCTPEGVDRLMMDAFGWPAGPFGMVRGATTGWEDEPVR